MWWVSFSAISRADRSLGRAAKWTALENQSMLNLGLGETTDDQVWVGVSGVLQVGKWKFCFEHIWVGTYS